MTTARDAIFQNTPSPDKTAKMEGAGGDLRTFRRPSRQSAEPQDLLDFAKRALDESAEKQRAHIDHVEAAHGYMAGETLELSHKGAKVLPLEVIELIKDRVERLALSHNNKIFLPQEITLCSRLYYLNLRWNNFTQFPDTLLQLSNLQTLDLSRNKITSIPDDIRNMTSLKFFAFTNNQVTHLPMSLGDMTSLTKLRLDDNPIQFPPAEDYLPSPEQRQRSGFDPNTYVCGQIKRYMRREKERQRQEMESEMSESNLETPKPLKRANTGRFPVRPSGGGPPSHTSSKSNENVFGDGRVVNEVRHYVAPPIPQKSVARDSLAVPPLRRPGLAPLAMPGLANRSRSETVAHGGQKQKRLGFVPSRKTSGPPSANSLNRDPSWMKPAPLHSRTNSSISRQENRDEQALRMTSPQDPKTRQPWMARSRLSSLPEDRRISKITSPTIRSARLLVYCLDQLNRPVDDVIRVLRSDSSRMSTAERLHVNATQRLKQLDAQLHILTPITETQRQETKDVRMILKQSRYCVLSYQQVVAELRLNARKLVVRGDPMYLRALMLQIHACLLEVRNACTIQEQTFSPPAPSRYSNVSQARSDRTVTPTQPTKPMSKRARGAKIIASMRENSPASATYSNPMLSAASSRTTTMTSMSLATPKSAESFGKQILAQKVTPLTNGQLDSDEAAQYEKIYLSLRHVCDLADQTFISCRQDFFVRKEGAARSMASTAARAWTLALNKCDQLMHALDQLKRKLTKVRLNDPANRKSRDFWLVCDSFFNAWYDLASEMKTLGLQGLDIGSIKPMMRPVQRAIKDASHLVNTSSLVRRSLDSPIAVAGPNGVMQQHHHHHHHHHQQQHSLPPTPLSAALGPAAQATVPNTPSLATMVQQAEYFQHYKYEKERERERSDTVTSRYGNGQRGR